MIFTGYKPSRFFLAILLPFLACGLQSLAWEAVQPFAWLFFSAAVFFSAWLGGRIGGLIATGISVLLVNFFFMEPRHTLSWISISQVGSTLMFIAMGTVFSFFHHHLRASIANQAATSQRFRTAFQNAPFGLALIDPLTKKIYQTNPRFSEITGRSPEELAILDSTFIFAPDDVPKILDHRGLLTANEIPGFQLNRPLIKPDGTLIWIGLSLSSVPVAPGKAPHHLLIIEDITTQREQQQALVSAQATAAKAESELRLGTFLRQGLGGILETTLDGRILKANPRFCAMLGHERAELLGKHIQDICHPDDWIINEEHLATLRDTVRPSFPKSAIAIRMEAIGGVRRPSVRFSIPETTPPIFSPLPSTSTRPSKMNSASRWPSKRRSSAFGIGISGPTNSTGQITCTVCLGCRKGHA